MEKPSRIRSPLDRACATVDYWQRVADRTARRRGGFVVIDAKRRTVSAPFATRAKARASIIPAGRRWCFIGHSPVRRPLVIAQLHISCAHGCGDCFSSDLIEIGIRSPVDALLARARQEASDDGWSIDDDGIGICPECLPEIELK